MYPLRSLKRIRDLQMFVNFVGKATRTYYNLNLFCESDGW